MAIAERNIFSQPQWDELTRSLELSPRQYDVVRCIFRGFSDKQIAGALEISISTVRSYLWRLFIKFDVHDRNELILHVVGTFLDECRNNGCPRR